MKLKVDDLFPGDRASVADVLLAVHRSYLSLLKPLLANIHAMAHITGGGIPGNLNRVLPANLDARVDTTSWQIPNLFAQLQRAGGVERAEMFRTFNMGVGMVVIAAEQDAGDIIKASNAANIRAWQLGVVTEGSGEVVLT
jgi:phosphoribosylformylglycinamidine cyclo-ligase